MLYNSNLSPMKCNIYGVVLLRHYLTQVASHTVIRICDFRKEPLDCKSDCSKSPRGKKPQEGKIIQGNGAPQDGCFPKMPALSSYCPISYPKSDFYGYKSQTGLEERISHLKYGLVHCHEPRERPVSANCIPLEVRVRWPSTLIHPRQGRSCCFQPWLG